MVSPEENLPETSSAESASPQETTEPAVADSQEIDTAQQPAATPAAIVESVSQSPLAPLTVTPLAEEPALTAEPPTPLPSATSTVQLETEPTPTPITASPTATPINQPPAPTVVVISDEPLLSEEQLSAMGVQENVPVSVVDWPTEADIVLQVGRQSDADAAVWRVSPGETTVEQASNRQPQEASSQQAIEELQKYNEAVDYAVVSPDGQWAAWGQGETLLVKRLGTGDPPVDLLGVKFESYQGGVGTLVWSPDSKQIAYAIENGNLHRFEIRISDPLEQKTNISPLWDTRPYRINWSSDRQYLIFEMLEIPQSGINHIYLISKDGSEPAQITQHGRVEYSGSKSQDQEA